MFIISQYILRNTIFTSNDDISQLSSYSMTIGLLFYTSIYIYFLVKGGDTFKFFNKIIMYITGVDLLLSSFYYYNIQQSATRKLKIEEQEYIKELQE